MTSPDAAATRRVLLGRIGALACAIPLEHVVEIMRPQPIEPWGTALAFVRGLAVIRGEPTPVIDTARLVGTPADAPTRLVLVDTGDRRIALEVNAVVDVREVSRDRFSKLPPLLRAATPEAVAAVAAADAELVVVLDATRIIPGDLGGGSP